MSGQGFHHDGHTALVRVSGALSTQIYRDEILQHHVVSLIKVTGGIFQLNAQIYRDEILQHHVVSLIKVTGGIFQLNAQIYRDEILQHHVVSLIKVTGGIFQLSAQIYRDEILQHHVVSLINVTGGIFQHANARPHTARVCRDVLLQNNVPCLTTASKIGRFISNRSPLGHRGSQRSSKEPSATNNSHVLFDKIHIALVIIILKIQNISLVRVLLVVLLLFLL